MYAVTTNAGSNTADGYALALRLGVEVVDMEMVQFHPTGMVLPLAMRGKLVTESVRGEGGRLFNRDGERFMERYNPQRLELAGRDEVARSIFSEVQAGRGTDAGGVYLSVAHLPAAVIEERLPSMLEQFLAIGVDIRKDPMQVHPSMHHMMGGIRIDDQGACNVPGLFAAGEVAGGEHGGNRLGGNALAGCQVMGRRAALSAARYAAQRADTPTIPITDLERELSRVRRYLQSDNREAAPYTVHQQLQKVMWEKVGIMRNEQELAEASASLAELTRTATGVRAARSDPDYNREWLECLELDNMLITARAVVYAAAQRTESRAAHYRRDYPSPSAEWERRNIVVKFDGDKFTHQIVNQSEL
jgi:fumarate reductase (CoM/CoB) subunit A